MEDIYFNKTMKNWDWVQPEHFEIKSEHRHDEIWKKSIKYLQKVEFVYTPEQKLACYTKAFTLIVKSIETLSEISKKAGNSQVIAIPIMIYLLMKACPEHIYTTMQYFIENLLKK